MARANLAVMVAAKRRVSEIAQTGSDALAQIARSLRVAPEQQNTEAANLPPLCPYSLKEAQAWQQDRKKSSGAMRDVLTRNALEQFRPVIEEWLDKKTVLDTTLYTLVAMWIADSKDFEFLIQMTDNAIANNATELDRSYIKSELVTFTVREMMNHIKEDFIIDNTARTVPKQFSKELPGYFFKMADYIYRGVWFPHPNEGRDIMNIAGDALLSTAKETTILYWQKSRDLILGSSSFGRKGELEKLLSELDS